MATARYRSLVVDFASSSSVEMADVGAPHFSFSVADIPTGLWPISPPHSVMTEMRVWNDSRNLASVISLPWLKR
jgi:hypothetical protein